MQTALARVERISAGLGVALLTAVVLAQQSWLDRHFLPSFFIPRRWYVVIETGVRLAVGMSGALFIIGRSRIAKRLTASPTMTIQVVVAAALALGASEATLRGIHLRPTEWLVPGEEPKRQPDPRLGWVLVPARNGTAVVDGRRIDYAIDVAGDRVPSVDEPVDPERPSILFAGESVLFGEGLTWEESIPAQTGAMLRVQSANLAVHGYSTDQIFMRLERELPRFRHPLAVVSIFMTELFGRDLDDDRPHLAPGLIWRPATPAPRLMSLAGLIVPFRRDRTVNEGIRMTRDVLRATVALARGRGAVPLILVPQFGPEDDAGRALRDRILDPDLPILVVRLDPDWRLAWDRHPNARAAHVIAQAVAARLSPR